jgi:hypothetical protein
MFIQWRGVQSERNIFSVHVLAVRASYAGTK